MTKINYAIASAGGTEVVTAYIGDKVKVANAANPSYDKIVSLLRSGKADESIIDLFDAEQAVRQRFERLSERVSVRAGRVYFDGDPLENDLSDHLLRVIRANGDVGPLVNFWERISANPVKHSRENLLRWLRATQGFTITSDGLIIGYKGLNSDSTSISSGPGIVNNVPVTGNLDNTVGNVVEIARSKVQHNPRVGCASGLHVGTWEYAKGFARGVIVEVLVDPRDVVSVPTDCAGQKMRVCRYKVVAKVTEPRDNPILTDYDEDDFSETSYDESAWTSFS